jgi:hypothetical protein
LLRQFPCVVVSKVTKLADGPAGAGFTVNVNVCGTPETLLVALKVMIKGLPEVVVGMPLRVPVPFPLSTNVTPLGSAPVSVNVGLGTPEATTVNVPGVPTVNVVLFPLVNEGATGVELTVRENACGTVELLLVALKVMPNGLPEAVVGVPLKVPVPLPLSTNVTPLGSVPVSVKAGSGIPVALTVNVPAVPTENVALLTLVNAGVADGGPPKNTPLATAFAPAVIVKFIVTCPERFQTR